MEPALVTIARARIEAEELRTLKARSKKITKDLVKDNKTLESFKEAFKEYIPMIEEAGVTCSAGDIAGNSYIEFKRTVPRTMCVGDTDKVKTIRMDYHSPVSYRYEYANRGYGTKTLGAWPKEDIIMFIYNGLFIMDYSNENNRTE